MTTERPAPAPDPAGSLAARAGAAGVSALSVLLILGTFPELVEHGFVERVGPRLTALVALPISKLPMSVAEWTEFAAALAGLAFLGVTAVRLRRGPGRWRIGGRAAGAVGVVAVWVGVLFYGMWGLAYLRPPAHRRMGFRPPEEVEVAPAELAALATAWIDRANRIYLERSGGWPDDLRPSDGLPPWLALQGAIDDGWTRMVAAQGLHPTVAASRGPSKPLRSSLLFTWLGIGGFYFPFTGEANINVHAPAWGRPHTIAHEMAHQRFFASEDEANYFGWLATVYAEDPAVRYAGWMFAHRQLLFALDDVDPREFGRVIRRRLPGVQRDATTSRQFWAGYEGPLERVSDGVNDAYLRLNRVRGGIRSYSASTLLVLEHARRRPLPP